VQRFALKKTGSFLFLIISAILFSSCTSTYFGRWVFWGPASIKDYEEFPARIIDNAPPSFHFVSDSLAERKFSQFFTKFQDTLISKNGANSFEDLLVSTGSTAFLVARGDTLLYEKYFNGYERNSINASFSIAKSFTSALVGIAIDQGYIQSVDDPITKYLPELRDSGFSSITIRHLLRMSSGIQYTDCGFPWCDEPKTYFDPNLRNVALNVKIVEKPFQAFRYNNYHPLLLGMILERVTHRSVSQYLEEMLWKPLGMEFRGSWLIDSHENGFEKMEGGITARAIDFLKFGLLFLNNGNWNGKQLIPERWVAESTERDSLDNNRSKTFYYRDMRLYNMYYKYFWWGFSKSDKKYDFFALGNLGQYIYVCPSKNLVICRFGKEYGKIHRGWEVLFRDFANHLYE
jgi:CubicO group peptidase (beta-lactamase class C family)